MPIYKLDDLENAVKREKLQVAIVSFGGSGKRKSLSASASAKPKISLTPSSIVGELN